jgi:tRNA threonylcarbamoyladenosine modification (KEOPS) complex  Pcc1 subunit
MSQKNSFSINSTIEFEFKNSQIRDFSYNSFLPEFYKLQTSRSSVVMEKKENSLLFIIECSDITAFRASISDIIGFGKIIDNCIELCE